MNKNHKLSEDTFGPRHVQPHQPKAYATKPKKPGEHFMSIDEKANKDTYRNKKSF